MNNNVAVIGLGYVGLTLSVVLARKGIKVYGIDIDDKIISSLRKGKSHFYEKGLEQNIKKTINKTLFVGHSFSKLDVKEISNIIITVGTPLEKGKKDPNFNHIKNAIDGLKGIYDGSQLIILRSTVSVGTTRKVIIPMLAEIAEIKIDDVLISFCPERTIEGNAIRELQDLPQIVSGNNVVAKQKAEKLFRNLTNSIITVESIEAAELIKLFNNTYRDINFAIGNIFNEIAQGFGINGVQLIKDANNGYKRSLIAMPGFVGGPCLEKDPYILVNIVPESNGKDFIVKARRFNESLEDKVCNFVTNNFSKKEVIGISGMAFKGRPSTSDMRGSSSLNIAKKLHAEGFKLRLHDFTVPLKDLQDLHLGESFVNLYDAVKDLNCLLILTNHIAYQDIDDSLLLESMSERTKILDIWNNLNESGLSSNNKHILTIGTYEI